ncbi:MAG: 30S ribosomal protein S19 [Thermoplasmatales archaeon]|nr:30S ribosomal protein S19 [Thermoplasmatales archaeon]
MMAERERKKIVTRRKKEFTYRGHTLEQMQAMPKDELIKILPARARRSLKRGHSEESQTFWKQVRKGKEIVETHGRDIIVLPELVGRKIGIHNGKEFRVVEIIPEMIGHYLGEFALTRRFGTHSGPGVGATRSSKYLPLR